MNDLEYCFSEPDAAAPEALWRLMQKVYAASEGMAESLEERYPDFAALGSKLAALYQSGGVAVIAANPVDGSLLAYAMITPRSPAKLKHTADLSMGVAPSAQGKGLGRAVLEAVLQRARTGRITEIVYLMVRSDNAAAIALYEHQGFERMAVLPKDTRVGKNYYDGVLMRLDLSMIKSFK